MRPSTRGTSFSIRMSVVSRRPARQPRSPCSARRPNRNQRRSARRPPDPCRRPASPPCGFWRHRSTARACHARYRSNKCIRAMSEDPTKPIAFTRASVSSMSTACLSPLTTLRMPAGNPASLKISAMRMGTLGSRSDGLRMKALPQAIAGAHFHSGIMAGKLNGVMPATTPSGWRSEKRSVPGPALSVYSPLSRCGMPQANSTTSRPRWMSPWRRRTPCRARRRAGGEIVEFLMDQFEEFEHHPRAALRVGGGPFRLAPPGHWRWPLRSRLCRPALPWPALRRCWD